MERKPRPALPQITERERWAAFPTEDLLDWLTNPPPAGPVRLRRVAPWRRLHAKSRAGRRAPTPLVLLGVAVAVVTCIGAAAAHAAELRLNFPDLRPEGQVAWAVHSDEVGWKRRGQALRSGVAAIGAPVVLELPPGQYGVMAYHDRNSDLKLNTLPIGLPTEPYGFSNNSRAPFGPPSWSAARFTLPAQGASQTIRLR